jgi:YD repeat-containing protein
MSMSEGQQPSGHSRRRTSLADARAARMRRPAAAAAYKQARLVFELAEQVRLRREELGWSQRQLAERAGMTQPGIARFEAGGTTPTLPLLERLAAATGGGTEPAGLVASITAPGGGVTSYRYDSGGDVMQVTNPLGLVTRYTYDNLGRQLAQTQISDTYPAGLTTSYTYDG